MGFSPTRSMPFVSIWIHAVWSTKNRQPLLHSTIRSEVFNHIRQNANSKGIILDRVNGYVDHAHAIISLQSDQTVSKVLQLLKGESSYWINKNRLSSGRFEWQDEYYAVSVSESDLPALRRYLDNQENHHRQMTFDQEYKKFTLPIAHAYSQCSTIP